jgi:O-acetyl-ADP-ribose deacetylase (regulator of RNase III)
VKKAGNAIQKECKDQHKEGIDIGNIAVTSAGNLKMNDLFFSYIMVRTSYIP